MIDFYISCKLKEGGSKQPSLIANAIRKCLFDNQIITSGMQFYIYVNAERYNFRNCKNATVLNFLCKIDRTTDLPLDELTGLLEPAFKILSEKNELDNFEISKS